MDFVRIYNVYRDFLDKVQKELNKQRKNEGFEKFPPINTYNKWNHSLRNEYWAYLFINQYQTFVASLQFALILFQNEKADIIVMGQVDYFASLSEDDRNLAMDYGRNVIDTVRVSTKTAYKKLSENIKDKNYERIRERLERIPAIEISQEIKEDYPDADVSEVVKHPFIINDEYKDTIKKKKDKQSKKKKSAFELMTIQNIGDDEKEELSLKISKDNYIQLNIHDKIHLFLNFRITSYQVDSIQEKTGNYIKEMIDRWIEWSLTNIHPDAESVEQWFTWIQMFSVYCAKNIDPKQEYLFDGLSVQHDYLMPILRAQQQDATRGFRVDPTKVSWTSIAMFGIKIMFDCRSTTSFYRNYMNNCPFVYLTPIASKIPCNDSDFLKVFKGFWDFDKNTTRNFSRDGRRFCLEFVSSCVTQDNQILEFFGLSKTDNYTDLARFIGIKATENERLRNLFS